LILRRVKRPKSAFVVTDGKVSLTGICGYPTPSFAVRAESVDIQAFDDHVTCDAEDGVDGARASRFR
jgi:hypothetical protein